MTVETGMSLAADERLR